MSWRVATEGDRPAVEAALLARADTSMFPLSNLARHGMRGGHPRAMSFLMGDGGVLGISEAGMLMPQVEPRDARAAALALREVWGARRIEGIVGETGQVRALRAALGLDGVPAQLDEDEPRFGLDLADLRMPDTAGLALAPLDAAPEPLLVAWRAAYGCETLGWPEEGAKARAAGDVALERAADSHRVLLRGGVPVAGTGFNARLATIVQVGGVWTPPDLRNQGLARAAVALHLAEARAEGVRRAVLFTSSEAAARAYRALGFREEGRFTILVLAAPAALP